jgi:hypothetical protein
MVVRRVGVLLSHDTQRLILEPWLMREKKRRTRHGDAEGRVYIDTAMHSLGETDTHCGGYGRIGRTDIHTISGAEEAKKSHAARRAEHGRAWLGSWLGAAA